MEDTGLSMKLWKCPNCAYINPVTINLCIFCKNTTADNEQYVIKKVDYGNGNNVAVPSNEETENDNLIQVEPKKAYAGKVMRSVKPILWKCPSCSYMNNINIIECEFCETVTEDNTSHIPNYGARKCGGIITVELTDIEAPKKDKPKEDTADKKEEEEEIQFIECPICLDIPTAVVVLKDCKHHYCRECLVAHIIHSPDVDVRCAVLGAMCQTYLEIGDIRDFLEDQFDEYLDVALVKAKTEIANKERVFYCQTPDCPVWWSYTDPDTPDDACVRNYVCPGCNNDNCLKCVALHGGKSCEEYKVYLQNQEDVQKTDEYLKELYATGKGLPCPKCGIAIIKDGGCDWGVCISCRTEFCFASKKLRRGPDGCGCIWGRALCVPHCGNCH